MHYPLDPLSESEITLTSSTIKNQSEPKRSWIFNSISLLQPPKSFVLKFIHTNNERNYPPRKSFSILLEKGTGRVFEATVNLDTESLECLVEVLGDDNQPNLTPEDCMDAERITKLDKAVQERCIRLGFPDMDLIIADSWPTGYIHDRQDIPQGKGTRLVQCFIYGQLFEKDNPYAHPLDFCCIVDLLKEKVVAIDELPGPKLRVIPKTPLNYDPELLPKDSFRADLNPIQIISPAGPSFTVTGHEVEWQKFKFRVGFTYREGLVLQNISYDGRPILYEASLAEMAVPYADPRPPFHRKCALDAGDCGLGFLTTSLELGCDCLGTIHYFDGILNNHAGEPMVIKNAICLHEEDTGVLFKHMEFRTGRAVATRSRRLVISSIVSIINYDYGFYWYFNLDGSIGFEVKATGELSTSLSDETGLAYGTTVAPGVNAQFHQHIFAMRLVPMIDGPINSVSTVDILPCEKDKAENPYGNGFTTRETKLNIGDTSDASIQTSRTWKIFNPSKINSTTNEPIAFKLVSNNPVKILANEDSFIWNKAAFARHSLWITKYSDAVGQRYPDGLYVFSRNKNWTGIQDWIKDPEGDGREIVLWHIFGLNHIPRVEDFPIMNVEAAGFTLKPWNFFTANPALDVPPENKINNASKLAAKSTCNSCE